MTSGDGDSLAEVVPSQKTRWTTVLLGFFLIVALFAGAAIYLSAEVKFRRAEAAVEAARAAAAQREAAEREALIARGHAETVAQAEELLKLAALPLSWAVRQDLQNRDYREIGIYFQQLVALRDVRRVALVAPDGTVKVASDKKLEGRPAAEALPGAALETDTPTVRQMGADSIEAVVPIMGLNTRLGTLVILYSRPAKAP